MMRETTIRRLNGSSNRQRGVVLIFTLIVLLILTIGAVALMRSMNTSLFGAGNLAFRRDLANQGEQALVNVLAEFSTGDLSTSSSTLNNVPADNYSATLLPSNSEGIPTALLTPTLSTAVGTHPDLAGAPFGPNGTSDVTIRYVIDRMCSATGAPNSTICVQSTTLPNQITHSDKNPKAPTATVYRLTVRVSGVRGTQVFMQTTFARPD
jgi:Tfp pilus assembly protein PilX